MGVIIAQSSDTAETHAALISLQNSLLPAAYHNSPLADVIERLETALAGRRPTINTALAAANPTLQTVVASLLDENAALAAHAPGGGLGISGTGSTVGNRDGHATTLAPFKALEVQMVNYDLLTEAGRRDAMTAALAPGNLVLVTRVLFREFALDKPQQGADRMAASNSMLTSFNSLRAHLHEYINWYMRVDHGTFVVDPKMMHYEFASLHDRGLLGQLTACAMDEMDFVKAPRGMLGYFQRLSALPKPLVVDKADYYCTAGGMASLSTFVSKLLRSVGVPEALPPGAKGYTFATFCAFYVEKLQLAGQLALLKEQYEHLAACDSLFRSALACMRVTLQSVIYHADVGVQTLNIAILAEDADPIIYLKLLATQVEDKARARYQLGALLSVNPSAAPAVDFNNLRLSDSAWAQMQSKKRKQVGDASSASGGASASTALVYDADGDVVPGLVPHGTGGGPGAGGAVALSPGSLAKSWKWMNPAHSSILVSGRVWNLKEIAGHLHIPMAGAKAPCWAYFLSPCAEQNRSARCDRWGQAGHKTDDDAAHAFTINQSELFEAFSRPATAAEKVGLVRQVQWTQPAGRGGRGRGKGKGKGKGSRGRGRQGQADFRVPSSL